MKTALTRAGVSLALAVLLLGASGCSNLRTNDSMADAAEPTALSGSYLLPEVVVTAERPAAVLLDTVFVDSQRVLPEVAPVTGTRESEPPISSSETGVVGSGSSAGSMQPELLRAARRMPSRAPGQMLEPGQHYPRNEQ